MDYSVMTDMFENYVDSSTGEEYPDVNEFYPTSVAESSSGMITDMMTSITKSVGRNYMVEEFVNELQNEMDPSWYKAMDMYYGIRMNMIAKSKDDEGAEVYKNVTPEPITTSALQIATQVLGDNGLETVNWYQLVGDKDYVTTYYDVIAGSYPKAYNEIVMVVDGNNKIMADALAQFGVEVYQRDTNGKIIKDGEIPVCRESIPFDEILNCEIKLVPNNAYYTKVTDTYYKKTTVDEALYNNPDNVTLKIVGVLRGKPNSGVNLVGPSLCYTQALSQYCVEEASKSDITLAQKAMLESGSDVYVLTGDTLGKDEGLNGSGFMKLLSFMSSGLKRTQKLKALGVDTTPTFINIYPKDFNTKNEITAHINKYNNEIVNDQMVEKYREQYDISSISDLQVEYFDVSEMFIHNMRVMLNLMTYVLIAVASISLIVSCVMISIITSNSVVERTREIGILRALGARKRDISRVFDAETAIIGMFSGALGIGIAYALVPLINLLIGNATGGVYHLLVLNPIHAALLVVLSLALTVLSGLVPSQGAARKNVVDALRIE